MNNNQNIHLKPCPFCGKKAEITNYNAEIDDVGLCDYTFYIDFKVSCISCRTDKRGRTVLRLTDGKPVISQDGYKMAIDAWNRRAGNE